MEEIAKHMNDMSDAANQDCPAEQFYWTSLGIAAERFARIALRAYEGDLLVAALRVCAAVADFDAVFRQMANTPSRRA